MGNAEEIKTLGEDMARAFEERKETISNIRKEVSELIGEFSKEREATGAAWAEVVSAMRGKRGAPGKPHKKSHKTAEV